jgi:NAD(P) transhydrogenase subunit alpha
MQGPAVLSVLQFFCLTGRERLLRDVAPWAVLAMVCLVVAHSTAGQDVAGDPADSLSQSTETSGEPTRSELVELSPADSVAPELAPQETVRNVTRQDLIASLTIFFLAVFVGFEVITKVPPTLHTPLMSGSNAISGITLVGAVIVAANPNGWFSPSLGLVAVTLATINAVGGFMVTHRMLAMFKR